MEDRENQCEEEKNKSCCKHNNDDVQKWDHGHRVYSDGAPAQTPICDCNIMTKYGQKCCMRTIWLRSKDVDLGPKPDTKYPHHGKVDNGHAERKFILHTYLFLPTRQCAQHIVDNVNHDVEGGTQITDPTEVEHDEGVIYTESKSSRLYERRGKESASSEE